MSTATAVASGKKDVPVAQAQFAALINGDPNVKAALARYQQLIRAQVAAPLVWNLMADRRRLLGSSQRWRDNVRRLLNGVLVEVGTDKRRPAWISFGLIKHPCVLLFTLVSAIC